MYSIPFVIGRLGVDGIKQVSLMYLIYELLVSYRDSEFDNTVDCDLFYLDNDSR